MQCFSTTTQITLSISFSHFFIDNIAAEAVVGIAPKFNLSGSGWLALDGTPFAPAKQWSPAILLKYYFGQAGDTWRPFVGLGASYFWYSNVTLHPNLQAEASQFMTLAQNTAVTTLIQRTGH